ncbi:MAG: fumarylacetoacetate hydrolase family protein [Actinomycetes bacterium]
MTHKMLRCTIAYSIETLVLSTSRGCPRALLLVLNRSSKRTRMKLACFNHTHLGVVSDDEKIIDVTDLAEPLAGHNLQQIVEKVLSNWTLMQPKFEAALKSRPGVPINTVSLLSPIPEPSKILCYGLNFSEFGMVPPLDKEIFIKPASSLIGSGGTVVLPEVEANLFYHEAELGIVIGKPAYKLAKGTGMDVIFGYTNYIDVTARAAVGNGVIMPNGRYSLFTGKSWDTFSPMGPYLVTADEVGDPLKLQVRFWLNNILRQDFPMSDIAFTIADLVENVSHITSLKVGDVITTGTNHSGLCALQHDDQAVQEIDKLGKLKVSISDSLRRTWPREPFKDLLENIYKLGKR